MTSYHEYRETELGAGVIIEGLDIPFWHLVKFLVKLAVAMIPALLILMVAGSVFWLLILGTLLRR